MCWLIRAVHSTHAPVAAVAPLGSPRAAGTLRGVAGGVDTPPMPTSPSPLPAITAPHRRRPPRLVIPWSVAAAAVLFLGGGVCTFGDDHPPMAGDIAFNWTLGGSSCATASEVTTIAITIPGEQLVNGGVYPCSSAGVDGVVLHDFAPGSYTWMTEARNAASTALYRASGTLTVAGNVTAQVDLTPVTN